MQFSFFTVFFIILLLTIFVSYYYKIINYRILIFLSVLSITCIGFSVNQYYKTINWVIVGSILTAISFLITARAFIQNEHNNRLSNKINLIKLESEILNNINKNFSNYKKELSYLYNDIFRIYGMNEYYDKNYDLTRDKSLEFHQSLKIFKGLQTLYTASDYGNDKTKYEYTGILDIFETFTLSQVLKEYWKKIKYIFSQDFINFIENEFYNQRINTDKVFI